MTDMVIEKKRKRGINNSISLTNNSDICTLEIEGMPYPTTKSDLELLIRDLEGYLTLWDDFRDKEDN
jgi:hypothetical protein